MGQREIEQIIVTHVQVTLALYSDFLKKGWKRFQFIYIFLASFYG